MRQKPFLVSGSLLPLPDSPSRRLRGISTGGPDSKGGSLHYYQFNIADWNLGTTHLSLVEEAIYLRLINYYYDTESPIPLETQSVFRRLRFGSDSVIAEQVLDEFFTKTEKGWTHKRCEDVIKKYKSDARKNRRNGAKGGRPRKDAACEETQEKPSGFKKESENNPNQEPLTINQEPLTKNQSNSKTTPAASLDYSPWPSAPDQQILKDWLSHRKQIKAPVSQTVINSFGKELGIAVGNHFTVDQCLEECMNRGWRGFKAEWMIGKIQPRGGGGSSRDALREWATGGQGVIEGEFDRG